MDEVHEANKEASGAALAKQHAKYLGDRYRRYLPSTVDGNKKSGEKTSWGW